jgi:hypothetical protein
MLIGWKHDVATGWRGSKSRANAEKQAKLEQTMDPPNEADKPPRAPRLPPWFVEACEALAPSPLGFTWALNLGLVIAGCAGAATAASFLTGSQMAEALVHWCVAVTGSFFVLEPMWVVLVAVVVLRSELKKQKKRRVNLRAKLLMKVKLAATMRRFNIASKHVTLVVENTRRGRSFDVRLSDAGEVLSLTFTGLAYEAGLRVGDKVVSIDGRPLEGEKANRRRLVKKMLRHPLGRTEFEVVRGEEGGLYDRQKIAARIPEVERTWGEARKVTSSTVAGERLGFDLGTLQLGGRAVIIVHVSKASALAGKVFAGDELLKINNMAFDASELKDAQDCPVDADGHIELEVRTPGYPHASE